MNITDRQLEIVPDTLRAMGARTAVLFGRMVESPDAARDVDMAVESCLGSELPGVSVLLSTEWAI
jgi:hypothetical protein